MLFAKNDMSDLRRDLGRQHLSRRPGRMSETRQSNTARKVSALRCDGRADHHLLFRDAHSDFASNVSSHAQRAGTRSYRDETRAAKGAKVDLHEGHLGLELRSLVPYLGKLPDFER
jgi:hypothetical protein